MRVFFAILFLFFFCSFLYQQPANNNCASATALTVNAAPVCGQTTTSSNTQVGEYIAACGAGGIDASVWYSFVATQANMNVWIDNSVTGGCHIAHAIYNTNACLPGAGNLISCKSNAAPTDMWHYLTGLTIGNTYLIQVMYNAGGPCGGGQTFCISVIAPTTPAGNTQTNTNLQNTYVSDCMVNTSGTTYYDAGGSGGSNISGAAGNYPNGLDAYMTFCPNTAGQCLTATINYLDMEPGIDVLQIRDGSTQNSPILVQASQLGNGNTYTATTSNGCLTFFGLTDATINRAGWNITIGSVACAANTAVNNDDCNESSFICGNASFAGSSSGPGILSEGCAGCMVSENHTNWYSFCISAAGTLNLLLNPTVNTDDYDFAIYGPNVGCNSLGSPIRCTYAATPNPGNTGLGNGATDVSEDVTGNSWLAPLNVNVGECYYMMINKWDPTPGSGFVLDWSGSTASLSCVFLPIGLLSFDAAEKDGKVDLTWATASEESNNYFSVQRSNNGVNFETIGIVEGIGTSNENQKYNFTDAKPFTGVSYYRLMQTDYDLQTSYSGVVTVKIASDDEVFSVHPNPAYTKASVQYNCISSSEEVVLRLFDYSGKNIYTEKMECKPGKNNIDLNLAEAPNGIYFVTLSTGQKIYKLKLLKQAE